MTGTVSLSSYQFATIQRSIDETSQTITRVVIHPDFERGHNPQNGSYAVRVVFWVLGYGTIHFVVDMDGKRRPVNDEGATEVLSVTGIEL